MANNNGGRVCPKCGMNLGQRHLCPVCDNPAQKDETTGGSAASSSSQVGDYVSGVIEFVEKHPEDWDEEFIVFFNGLAGKPDVNECYDACSKVSGIFKIRMPDSGKIPGSLARQVMADLQSVFPELTNDSAFALACDVLKKRVTPAPASPENTESGASDGGTVITPGKNSQDRYQQLKYELLEYDVRDDFRKVTRKMNALLKEFPDRFKEDYRNFYIEIFLGNVKLFHLFPGLSRFCEPESLDKDISEMEDNVTFSLGKNVRCPLAFFAALMNPEWNQFIRDMQQTEIEGRRISEGRESFLGTDFGFIGDHFNVFYCAYGFDKPDRKLRTSEALYINGPSHERVWVSDDTYQFVSDRDNRYNSRWHELVPKGKTVLILATGENIELRSPSNPDKTDYSEGDLVDGLEYRCTDYSYAYAKGEFAYMVSPE